MEKVQKVFKETGWKKVQETKPFTPKDGKKPKKDKPYPPSAVWNSKKPDVWTPVVTREPEIYNPLGVKPNPNSRTNP